MELPTAAGKAEAHTQQGRVQGIGTSFLVGMPFCSLFYKMGGEEAGLGLEVKAWLLERLKQERIQARGQLDY